MVVARIAFVTALALLSASGVQAQQEIWPAVEVGKILKIQELDKLPSTFSGMVKRGCPLDQPKIKNWSVEFFTLLDNRKKAYQFAVYNCDAYIAHSAEIYEFVNGETIPLVLAVGNPAIGFFVQGGFGGISVDPKTFALSGGVSGSDSCGLGETDPIYTWEFRDGEYALVHEVQLDCDHLAKEVWHVHRSKQK